MILAIWRGESAGMPRCISCWEPTPEERALIAAGGPVWLWVVGHTHPPLVLDAANPFEPAPAARPTVAESFRDLHDRLAKIADEMLEEAGDIGQGAPAHDLAARLEGWACRLRGEEPKP